MKIVDSRYVKRNVKIQGFRTVVHFQNLLFYEQVREPMLSSFTKYDKLANLKHVDSKKIFSFARGVYRITPGSVATSSPNRLGGWREAGEEAGREAEREAGGEAGGRKG